MATAHNLLTLETHQLKETRTHFSSFIRLYSFFWLVIFSKAVSIAYKSLLFSLFSCIIPVRPSGFSLNIIFPVFMSLSLIIFLFSHSTLFLYYNILNIFLQLSNYPIAFSLGSVLSTS